MVNNTLVETSVLSTDIGNVFYGTALSVIVSNLLLGIIYLFLGSAFAHLAFKITGGTGNRRKTMAIVGYSMMPVVIFRLFGLLLVLLNPATVSMANPAAWEALVMDIYNSTLWTTLDYMTTAS
ncbi:MAG: Yip1 family protein, partial [Candidatus Thorarchaeota archaeon]